MGILLIESSSKKIEFGYLSGNELLINETLDPEDNADKLVYYLKSAFEQNGIKTADIETVSLSNGPGSFTGLRIGSAIAKGICFAGESKLIEIPTLDIIANKSKTSGKVTSLIYSNSRTNEFYYCNYIFESGLLKRISDYRTGFIEEIVSDNTSSYLINENLSNTFQEKYREKLTDVSEISGIISQAERTKSAILKDQYSNYRSSKPFYMKEFIPNK
ncbi:MAG TPA: tRNA (adenosine(37)-N6)-threonylcarbamoyltransferase complex dimerization subunit type 1 TsaB [Ignavibacteria bacterium]|nr:tRNA (adenosine(37)-N6)-threonylcarbamoyltransferase complex dimerization subunit type 1 TsaB [Ignavibacteria bacterium]